jgi:hypothetical protein
VSSEYLVILTVQLGAAQCTETCVVAAEGGGTRADLYEWALGKMIERHRDEGLRQGAVLFFSAEPMRLEATR